MGRTMESAVRLWRDYSRRFTPSLMSRVKSSRKREVSSMSDKISSDEALTETVYKFLSCLHEKMSGAVDGRAVMKYSLGYTVCRAPSKLSYGGEGVILSDGRAEAGSVIALYPGTVYRRFEPVFLPSIGNHFVLRCIDGIHIDGNDRYLSKIIYNSCVGRDSVYPFKAADASWLTEKSIVPWNIGQYVNNGTNEFLANVAYQELDLHDFPSCMYYLLPNIWYSGRRSNHMRLVALVAVRTIEKGDEVLSNYYTVVNM